MLIFMFLFLAISRQMFTNEAGLPFVQRLRQDREVRITVLIVSFLPLALFLRHWVGALDDLGEGDVMSALRAFWGGLFTVLSFLLPTPGLVLAGLAIVGGGAATTAGGVRLLRVYALYKHGTREMGRLVHPSSIGSAGALGRNVRREGAFIAWIFFMLFGISIAAVILALTATGLEFEAATSFAIAALSTTGPLVDISLTGEDAVGYAALTGAAKSVLIAAMVVGRLETLAIIALFNPDFWRS